MCWRACIEIVYQLLVLIDGGRARDYAVIIKQSTISEWVVGLVATVVMLVGASALFAIKAKQNMRG